MGGLPKAEGLVLSFEPEDFVVLGDVERDEHGHGGWAEVDLGDMVKKQVQARLTQLGITITIAAKDIGYELRCADPIPFDMEYTRDSEYRATKYLL